MNALWEYIKSHIGVLVALISLCVYIILLITCIVFVSTILLLGLIIVLPLILVGAIRNEKVILKKRVKASSWALGFLVLILFPAFWLLPQQIFVRVNRQETLLTPENPYVEEFSKDFLKSTPGYENMTFKERAEKVSEYTTEKIKWRVDYETYGMAGHVATPEQCIQRGEDDCQGQAVTMASLLLNLDFKHVWVVETPFHWYVIVRDPSKEKLESGWERHIEDYQENGEVLPLNRDGEGSMPEWRLEEVVLIFNDQETLFPRSALEAIWIGWTATAFFYDDIFPIFLTFEVLFLLLGILALSVPLSMWTYYMSSEKSEIGEKKVLKTLLLRSLVLAPLLFFVFFIWFLIQEILWDYTLIMAISEISLIVMLSSEEKVWRSLSLGL